MLNQFTPNTKISSSQENANWTNFSNHGRNFTITWPFGGTLLATTLKQYLALPDNATITRIDLIADGAPTGQAVIVDIQKSQDNGATWNTIFTVGPGTNRPQIAAGARAGNTTTIDNPAITKLTDYFRPVVSQVGSGNAGSDMMVMMRGQYNLD